MEYTPQHQMFEAKRLQLLSMYNNASELLKGKAEEEVELEFEDEDDEPEEEVVEKGEDLGGEMVKGEDEKEDEDDEEKEDEDEALTKAEAFGILEQPILD